MYVQKVRHLQKVLFVRTKSTGTREAVLYVRTKSTNRKYFLYVQKVLSVNVVLFVRTKSTGRENTYKKYVQKVQTHRKAK